jgi:predicted nucleic acid-binding protein
VPSVVAVLDASVLFPAALRDTLLRAAHEGLYRPHWSDAILVEVYRNLIETGRTSQRQAQSLIATMQEAFPDATVTGFEPLVDRMTNHPKDRHVLAAAVAAGAQVIVTSNVRDFPERALGPFKVEAHSPDTFLVALFDAAPEQMVRILTEQAADLHAPPMTIEEVLDQIAVPAPGFAALVRARLPER